MVSRILLPDPCGDSSPAVLRLGLGDFTLTGVSVAARATGFVVEELGVVLDLGRMSPLVAAQPLVLLSHGHLDHLAAVLAYLNVRARFHPDEAPLVLAPAAVAWSLRQALAVMPGMESVRRRLDLERVLVGMEAGDGRVVHGLEIQAFAVDHGVPALGWSLRRSGADRWDVVFAGDGSTAPFVSDPGVLDARVAMVECTFAEPNRRLAARFARHAHLLDWVELAPGLRCDTLVVTHLPELPGSRLRELAAPLAAAFAGRLVLWAQP